MARCPGPLHASAGLGRIREQTAKKRAERNFTRTILAKSGHEFQQRCGNEFVLVRKGVVNRQQKCFLAGFPAMAVLNTPAPTTPRLAPTHPICPKQCFQSLSTTVSNQGHPTPSTEFLFCPPIRWPFPAIALILANSPIGTNSRPNCNG